MDPLKSFVCILTVYKRSLIPCDQQLSVPVHENCWPNAVVLSESLSCSKLLLCFILHTLLPEIVSHTKLGLHGHGLCTVQHTGEKN